jgi:phosphoribosyl-dephospho-CoA transferase
MEIEQIITFKILIQGAMKTYALLEKIFEILLSKLRIVVIESHEL